jgi:hypothetical protein
MCKQQTTKDKEETAMKFRRFTSFIAILLAAFSVDAFACNPKHPGCNPDDYTHKMNIRDFQGQSVNIKHNGWGYWVGEGAASMKTLEFTSMDPNEVPQTYIQKGYCVELEQGIGNGSYDVELKKLDPNSAWQMGAAWMVHNIKVDTDFEYAAMQVAIWEVVYDGIANFDPNKSLDWWLGGDFRVSGLYSGDIKAEAISYLEMLHAASDFSGLEGYRLATNCYNQDMLVAPIPGAVWLMGSGLIGLVGMGRRRNSKKA